MSKASDQPCGVIDIGSNSVRLVLFDGIKRAPASYFNEKVLCGLGRDIVTTGRLNEEGWRRAIEALSRFRVICEKSNIANKNMECFATAAVREASDGPDFIKEANEILGLKTVVLSGEEESFFAAKGVLTGMPDMNGWVADLGGGSLELAEVADGDVSHTVSHPFGPFRLAGMKRKVIKQMLREAFAAWDSGDGMGTLILVGGAWRTLAKVHMARTRYPIKVLHHYSVGAKEAKELATVFSKQSITSLSEIAEISARRLDTIALAALVLRELIKALKPSSVVVSAHGVREGILYERLDEDERARDPLIEGAKGMAERRSFDPEIGDEVFDFAVDFFAGRELFERRLLEAACRLSNIAWRDHPNYRRANILHAVLYAPLDGITHHDRICIALSLYYRYGGESTADAKAVVKVVGSEEQDKAKILGAFLRFSHTLIGQSTGILPACKLHQDEAAITLEVSQGMSGLIGEIVVTRLEALGELMQKSVKVEIRDYL